MKKLVLALWLTLLSTAAFAQLGTPRAPRDLAPAHQQQRGYLGGLTTFDLPFTWTSRGSGTALQPVATHFAFCLVEAAGAPPCTFSNSRSVMLASGGLGLAPPAPVPPQPGQPVSTDRFHTFKPAAYLLDSLLDKPLSWTVGACAQNPRTRAMQCSFASPQGAYYVARNIVAMNADLGNSTATALNVDARASTPGLTTNDSGEFSTTVHAWEVLRGIAPNGAPICRTDVNSPDVADLPPNLIHYAFFGNRREIRVADLPRPNGVIDNTGVIAIYRAGSWYDSHSGSWPGLATNTASRGVLVANFNVSTTGKAFVATTHIDPANAVIEFDENDNVNSRCKAF